MSGEPETDQVLLDALTRYDESTRRERAERAVWVGQHSSMPSVVMGRTETLHLLNEARAVFVNGHFASALMMSISVIEHSLVEECQLRGLFTGSPALAQVLKIAEDNSVLPADWFPTLHLLVQRRNPCAHLKDPAHEHGLGRRVRKERLHPQVILRQDAEIGLRCMYDVFRTTLREVVGAQPRSLRSLDAPR
jgi:hypothetical protein